MAPHIKSKNDNNVRLTQNSVCPTGTSHVMLGTPKGGN